MQLIIINYDTSLLLITTKQHFCSHLYGSNSVVAFLCQEKNSNRYYDAKFRNGDTPSKKDTHKLHRQACLMPECIEGQTEFNNSMKNEEDC